MSSSSIMKQCISQSSTTTCNLTMKRRTRSKHTSRIVNLSETDTVHAIDSIAFANYLVNHFVNHLMNQLVNHLANHIQIRKNVLLATKRNADRSIIQFENSKKRFIDQHSIIKNQSIYENRLQQWIIKNENFDDNNEKKIAHFFEKLTIDALNKSSSFV
jgi:hypothetical protein